MRALVPVVLSAVVMLAAPAVASADGIFDAADADALASTLKEASDVQDVCYGWDIKVDDQASYGSAASDSVGSNDGAGKPVGQGCPKYVVLNVHITWTSESSESEDSSTWDIDSSSGGPTRADMEALELDLDGLDGDNPDVPIAQMIAALPLLAADKGMAKLVEAAPADAEPSSDAALTDSPGSDWWRGNGGMFLWGMGILLAGGIFAWWLMRANRGRERLFPRRERVASVPDTIPDYLVEPEPPTEPFPEAQPPKPEPETAPFPAATEDPAAEPAPPPEPAGDSAPPAEDDESSPAGNEPAPAPDKSTSDGPTGAPERPADQKDKE